MKLHTDVLAHQPLQHSAHVADDFVKFQGLRLHHLLAAEGQQLPGQVGRALCGGGDLFQGVDPFLAPVLAFVQEHAGVTEDDAEDIVKVMGHPGG